MANRIEEANKRVAECLRATLDAPPEQMIANAPISDFSLAFAGTGVSSAQALEYVQQGIERSFEMAGLELEVGSMVQEVVAGLVLRALLLGLLARDGELDGGHHGQHAG